MEKKNLNMSGFKFSSEGSGSCEGIGNKMFAVDEGADIVIGVSKLDEFKKRGFIGDTHGLGNGWGSYTTATKVGVPYLAEVRNNEDIYFGFNFYDTEYAQTCRKVMMTDAQAGADVSFSIGYDLSDAPIWINSDQYIKELPNYIPSQFLARCLEGAKRFDRVRLIKVTLNEISTVPIPMNRDSVAAQIKSNDMEPKEFLENKGGIDRSLYTDLKESIEVLEWTVSRCKRIAAKDGINKKSDKELKNLFSQIEELGNAIIELQPELKAGRVLSTTMKEQFMAAHAKMKALNNEHDALVKSHKDESGAMCKAYKDMAEDFKGIITSANGENSNENEQNDGTHDEDEKNATVAELKKQNDILARKLRIAELAK